MDVMLPYTGIIASIWLIVGIYLASLFYPNYSHTKQFCSELGAFGSPTQKLSPAINNYPLGLLFVLYGYYLITLDSADITFSSIGIMVIVHGICTWVCGYFPMDADPYTKTPSTSCKIHTWSGLIMLLSFVAAPLIVTFSSNYPTTLRVLSMMCVVGCIFFSYKLAKALEHQTIPGVHQRLSYGFQILWLFVFSFFVIEGL